MVVLVPLAASRRPPPHPAVTAVREQRHVYPRVRVVHAVVASIADGIGIIVGLGRVRDHRAIVRPVRVTVTVGVTVIACAWQVNEVDAAARTLLPYQIRVYGQWHISVVARTASVVVEDVARHASYDDLVFGVEVARRISHESGGARRIVSMVE